MRFLPFRGALAVALLATPASAQTTVMDEGSFTISRGGARIGREEFIIRRTSGPSGDVFVATSTVALENRRVSPVLQADSEGSPLRYQVEVKAGADVQERLVGQIGNGRASVRLRTPSGESTKEYVVADGAVILDDDVFHQYYFLARGNRSGAVPVVVPRRNLQLSVRVDPRGAESLAIGGATVDTRHLVVTEPGGASRDVWVDAQGRVLKVALSDRGILAVRDAPPR